MTECILNVYLATQPIIARSLLSCGVRLSVYLSRWCIETANFTMKLFHRLVAHPGPPGISIYKVKNSTVQRKIPENSLCLKRLLFTDIGYIGLRHLSVKIVLFYSQHNDWLHRPKCLPRDATHNAVSLLSCGVRLLVTLMYRNGQFSYQTFSSPGGPIILIFQKGTQLWNSDGHPQQGRQIEVVYTKNLRFSTSISEIPIPNRHEKIPTKIPIPTQL